MKFIVKYNVLVHPQKKWAVIGAMQPLYLRLVIRANLKTL